MVSNLIENAVRYGDGTTTIEVVVRGTSSHPGTKTDDSNSLGLGLYIVRQIVDAHDGDITARSTQNETVFTVRLPRHARPEILWIELRSLSQTAYDDAVPAAQGRTSEFH